MKLTDKTVRLSLFILVFLNAFIAYAITMAPTLSFWDCGEFVAAAHTLGVPHPPGTPFFMIIGRFFDILLPFVSDVAARFNYISVLTSALTVSFVFLFVYDFMNKLFKTEGSTNKLHLLAPAVGGLVASFLITFSDTFWFNAVEAEVYGIAMLFVMIICWLTLDWTSKYQTAQGDKIIVLITYLAFLGSGFHLYSLITIPVVFVIVLTFDKDKRTLSLSTPIWVTGFFLYSIVYAIDKFVLIALALFIAALLIKIVHKLLSHDVQENVAAKFILGLVTFICFAIFKDFQTYNQLEGVDKALMGFWIFFAGLVSFGVSYFHTVELKKQKSSWSFTLALAFVALIGFSTHAYIPIRSSLNPIIDENNPELALKDVFNLEAWKPFNDFVGRKQYGSESMLKRSFHRRGKLQNQILSFPHMGYGGYQFAQYFPWKVGEVRYTQPGTYVVDAGENEPVIRGGTEFDTQMIFLGDDFAGKLKQFIIFAIMNGVLLWVCWLIYKRNHKLGIYVFLLLLVTSAGLIFYMNFADGTRPERIVYENWIKNGKQGTPQPVHLEVRDRDYFFSPAFILMSVIYGLGAALLVNMVSARRREYLKPVAIGLVVVAYVVPCFSNYKEHNRAGLHVPWDYAYNLISSCQPNGILFTNGDNDTFPLWFIQEVARVRNDVRVVNLSLGNTKWYIHQLLDNAPTVKLSYTHSDIDKFLSYSFDKNVYQEKSAQASEKLLPLLKEAQIEIDSLKKSVTSGTSTDEILSKKMDEYRYKFRNYIAISSFADWGKRTERDRTLKIQDKLVLDITRQNPDRPIHFATTVSVNNYIGLEKYMKMDGMVYTLVDTTLAPSNRKLDAAVTRSFIDTLYQFRGLGDGTTYINPETSRLMNNYNSMYIHVAFEEKSAIERLVAQKNTLQSQLDSDLANTSLSEQVVRLDAEIKVKTEVAKKYLDLGMNQFPNEWRSYAVMSDIFNASKNHDAAIDYVNRGLERAKAAEKGYLVRQKLSILDMANKVDEALAFINSRLNDPYADKNLLLQFQARFQAKKK
ncbi:MAG: DUF2723 domain-containing protein [Fibrobacterales bacterium]